MIGTSFQACHYCRKTTFIRAYQLKSIGIFRKIDRKQDQNKDDTTTTLVDQRETRLVQVEYKNEGFGEGVSYIL